MQSMNSSPLKILGIMFVLSTVFAVFTTTTVLAVDAYPSKSVRLIVPFAPGGGADMIARLFMPKLSERLGKQVIIENHGGGGTVIGTEMVARAAPDGYTLLMITGSHITNQLIRKLPYDLVKSFVPIAKLATSTNALVIHSKVPANSVKELIALAKQKPGQLIFASSGLGSHTHLGAELLKMMANINFKIVHFKGGGPANIDVLGGHSDISLTSLFSNLPNIQSGKFKLLGTTGLKRSTIRPDVPTISESGLPGYETQLFFAILGPIGMPAQIVNKLNDEIKVILDSDEVKKQFLNVGMDMDYLGPAEFGQVIEKDLNKWARVIKEANIKVEE